MKPKKKDNDDKTLKRKCINCHNFYHEAQNSLDSCSFHDGALVRLDIRNEPITKEKLQNMLFEEFKTKKEIMDHAEKYIFLCCITPFLEGKEGGCKRNKHSDESLYIYDPKALKITESADEPYFFEEKDDQNPFSYDYSD